MLMVNVPPPPYDKVGGVLLINGNLKDLNGPGDVITMTNDLQKGRNPPLFIAVDNEGGFVQRLNNRNGFTDIPKAIEQGKTSLDSVYNFGRIGATELAAVGINWNFGTVADLHNSKSPIIGKFGRAFSSDPEVISADVLQSAQAQIDAGVIPAIKHFPGHGDSTEDSHVDYAVVNKTKEQMES
jgi:beta-N-acetylhexosaminidase